MIKIFIFKKKMILIAQILKIWKGAFLLHKDEIFKHNTFCQKSIFISYKALQRQSRPNEADTLCLYRYIDGGIAKWQN